MMYLDLDELPGLFDRFRFWSIGKFNLASFRREDHLGHPSTPLKQSVYDLVDQRAGIQLDGPVYLLTHLRYFGYGFNPVSFYYCHSKTGELKAIVAEVNNTPWGEQHCYVLPASQNTGNDRHHQYQLDKEFHVSPFNPMQQQYAWRIRVPDDRLGVHLENWQHDQKIFDASLSMKAKDISSANLAGALIKFPAMTVKIIVTIYWQALKLWLKKTPIYDHPDTGFQHRLKHDKVD